MFLEQNHPVRLHFNPNLALLILLNSSSKRSLGFKLCELGRVGVKTYRMVGLQEQGSLDVGNVCPLHSFVWIFAGHFSTVDKALFFLPTFQRVRKSGNNLNGIVLTLEPLYLTSRWYSVQTVQKTEWLDPFSSNSRPVQPGLISDKISDCWPKKLSNLLPSAYFQRTLHKCKACILHHSSANVL